MAKYEVILVCLGFLEGLCFFEVERPDWVEDLLYGDGLD